MGRSGGWILGLVAVTGMAAAAYLGLRPLLFRQTLFIDFVGRDDWKPQEETGVRLAFEEKGFRAGGFTVQPEFHDIRTKTGPVSHVLTVYRHGDLWGMEMQSPDVYDESRMEVQPSFSQVGLQAAVWCRKKGMTRVFLLDAGGSAAGFDGELRRQAKVSGIDCRSPQSNPQGKSLVDLILASEAHLVIVARPFAPGVIDALKTSGYAGQFLVVDASNELPAPPASEESVLAGSLLVSRFWPPPKALAAKDYFGYLSATIALDAIDRAGTADAKEIFRILARSPQFSSDGSSTVPGSLYLVKPGALEFVEPLK